MKRYFRGMAAMLSVAVIYMLLEHRTLVFAAETPQKSTVNITVRSSGNAAMFSTLEIDSPKLTKALAHAKKENCAEASFLSDMDVTLLQDQQETHFRLERSGNLWNELELTRLVLSTKVQNKILNYAEELRQRHYGKLLRWEEAKDIITLKSYFSITDLETGLTFKVQRRAGSKHADVQPLTKKDSEIMKRIYNGRWSWKRKAILVQSGNERLAASMNGMPHGGDGIPGNGFSGHFCVHFLGSTSHRSDVPDPAHQLMVYKATGNLRSYFDSVAPLELAESFVEAMYQRDSDMLRLISEGLSKEKIEFFEREMESLSSIRINKKTKPGKVSNANNSDAEESLTAEIKLPITIYKEGRSKRNFVYSFVFRRESMHSPWRIEEVIAK